MSGVTAWIAGAGAAGRLVGSRARLWPAGAVGALAYLGWVPLVLTVAPSVRSSQLILFGAGLVSASLFPVNLLLIATGLAGFVLVACALAAIGESAVLGDLARLAPTGSPGTPDTGTTFAVLVVAILPAAIAAGALVAGLAFLAPDALTSPDEGVPLLARLTTALGPFVVALASMMLVGQALGAAAIRRVAGAGSRIVPALGQGLVDILHRPARRLGIAFVGTLTDLASVVLGLVLLRTAWAPIGSLMGSGRFLSPQGLMLLAGFVLIWLVTVAVMGAAHAWISAWWSLELASPSAESAP